MKTALLSLALFGTLAQAVIVDGVAITVGNRVITRSEIDLRIRLTAFFNDAQPEASLQARREAAQRLIEQKLVEREMDLGRYRRGGTDAMQPMLEAYVQGNFKGDAAAFGARASGYGLSAAEVGADLVRQSDFLEFLNVRFRPAVQVSDEEVRKYFTEKYGATTPREEQETALIQQRPQIEEELTLQAADREMDVWLKDQRQRTRIDFVDKDLMETGGK